MKYLITNLFVAVSVSLGAQNVNNEKVLDLQNGEGFPALEQITLANKSANKSENTYQKDDHMFNSEYKAKPVITDHFPDKVTEMVYFPEGFTMNLPRNQYLIAKENGKYVFQYKNTPSERANFEVFITENNIQEALADNNYFLISKNEKLAMYAVCAINEETNRRKIIGFRLFYTINIGKGVFATSRSDIFKDYKLYSQYIDDVVNIDPCYNIAYNNIDK